MTNGELYLLLRTEVQTMFESHITTNDKLPNIHPKEEKMKKVLLLLIASIIMSYSFAQESVKAEKEVLSVLKYGTADTFPELIGFDDEIDRFPKGPFIDNNGVLIFDFNQPPYHSIVYKEKAFKLLKDRFVNLYSFPLSGQNANGIIISPNQAGFFVCTNNKIYFIDDFLEDENVDYDDVRYGSYYSPVGKGLLIDYVGPDGPYRLGVEVNSDFSTKVISKFDSKDWLEKQKGNYKVSNDNKVYKNSMQWTPDDQYGLGAYIGRLKSGHCIYTTDDSPQDYFMREFVITRPDGTIELSLEIPWSASFNYDEGKSFYSWSFGNWGELYALIYPPFDSNHSRKNGKKEIELVVSRNYLKYFGILNDDRIRLRKGPGTNTESLGTYPIKTGFRILENSGVKQTIDGVTAEWIKVRLLDGTEGYFYGQYVQTLYDGPGTPLPWPNIPDWD